MKPLADDRGDDGGKGGPIFARRLTTFGDDPRRPPVSHDYAALAFFVTGGSCVLRETTWTLEPGDVLIVPAGERHRHIEKGQQDAWSLGFCVPCLAAETSTTLLEPFERVRAGASPVVRIPAERHAFLERLFRELCDAPAAESAAAHVRLSLLTLILNEVVRAAAWPDAAASSERTIVASSLRFIERHCLGPLTLTDVAAAMKRTPSYITTALTRATGRSAVAWIIAGRMAEARRRLLHSDESVDLIAERVGYADPTHFIRMFRRVHGATPAAWRAMQRGPRPATKARRPSPVPR